MKRSLSFIGCLVSIVYLFGALGAARQINELGAFKVFMIFFVGLAFGCYCAITYYLEKYNDHTYIDPKTDIQTLANYEKYKK